MHIKSCYVPNEKYHITRHQEIKQYKQAQKGDINEYSENIKASI